MAENTVEVTDELNLENKLEIMRQAGIIYCVQAEYGVEKGSVIHIYRDMLNALKE